MPLTSPIQEFFIKPLPGMNTKQEDLELDANFVELSQNTRYENEPGAVLKRDPTTYYNTTSMGSGAVMGGFRFYRTDGSYKTIAVHGTSVYVGTDATGVFTALTLPAGFTLTENKRMAFEVYQDLLIMSNGSDNIFVYDGASSNTCWELGSCKCALGTGAGVNTRTGVSYMVTMDNDAYCCGAVSNAIATVTAPAVVELTNIPIGPATTANRKIYRKDNTTGGSYKLMTTIADNSTPTYTDTMLDVSGAAVYPGDTDDFPKGNILKVHRERLFITGDPDNPNRIYYTHPYAPWYIQQTTNLDYMEIDKNDGDEIMGIPISLGTMVCVKKNTIRKINISVASGSWDSGGGYELESGSPASWYADDPLVFTGSPAQWSIVQTQFGILMLGWDHWYLFNGVQLTPVIDEFDTRTMLPSSYYDVVAFFHNQTLMWAYTDAENGNNYHDTVGRFNFFRKTLSIDTFTRDSNNTGINCFFSYQGDDESGDLYYGDSRNGYVYKAEDTPQWIRWNKKSQLEDGTKDDIFIGGTEDNPWFEVGWDVTIDELTQTYVTPTGAEDAWVTATVYHNGDVVLSGGNEYVCSAEHTSAAATEPGVGGSWATVWGLDTTALSIDKLPGVIDRNDTDGVITFNVLDLHVGSFINLFWNGRKYNDADIVSFEIRTGNVAVPDVTWTAWSAFTSSPADLSGVTSGRYVQLRCQLTCNSTEGSPRVYYSDGYVIKMNYRVGGTIAENEVEYIYDTGWRNFNTPFVDKIWKKIGMWHEGNAGLVTIEWWTEFSNGTFVVDLSNFPMRWDSFFPSTATGRKLRIRFYKNDNEDYKLKEVKGLYTPEPIIV